MQQRKLALISSFNRALIRGTQSTPPLEAQAHDSRAFTLALLAWGRQAVRSQYHFFSDFSRTQEEKKQKSRPDKTEKQACRSDAESSTSKASQPMDNSGSATITGSSESNSAIPTIEKTLEETSSSSSSPSSSISVGMSLSGKKAIAKVLDALTDQYESRLKQAIVNTSSQETSFLLSLELRREHKYLYNLFGHKLAEASSYSKLMQSLAWSTEEHFFELQRKMERKLQIACAGLSNR